MRKGGKAVRLRLFDTLSRDLAETVLGKRDVIQCPLCLRESGRDAAERGVLTEEHVIPESTGNQEVTLTCKRCNDRLGHEIDGHLARKVRLDRGFKSGEKMKGHLRWPDGGAPADVFVNPGRMHFILKPTTPKMESAILERMLQHAPGDVPLRMRLNHGLSLPKYFASVTKAAYLGLFVDRGYRYALLPALDPICRAITEYGPDRKQLPEIVIPSEITGFTEVPNAPDRFTFETHSLNGVPVCLSMVNLRNRSDAAWVVLPPGTSANTGSWDGLARAAEALKRKLVVRVELKTGGEVMCMGCRKG